MMTSSETGHSFMTIEGINEYWLQICSTNRAEAESEVQQNTPYQQNWLFVPVMGA